MGQSQLDHRVCIQHPNRRPNLKCMGTAVVLGADTSIALEVRFVAACRKGPLTLDSLATSLQSLGSPRDPTAILHTTMEMVGPPRVPLEYNYLGRPNYSNLKIPTTNTYTCPMCLMEKPQGFFENPLHGILGEFCPWLLEHLPGASGTKDDRNHGTPGRDTGTAEAVH